MAGQRLSQRRGKAVPDGPYEGVPEHLVHGLVHWYVNTVRSLHNRHIDEQKLRELAVFLRAKVHPGWGATDLVQNLLNDAQTSDDDFLDLLDGILQIWNHRVYGDSLSKVLAAGGSVWRAADDGLSLVRIVTDESQATFDAATSIADAITTELAEAWSNAFGRNGDPSDAWEHSVKAMEALFIPMITPNQTKANLGHPVGQLHNQGHLYRLVLPGKDLDNNVAPLVGMLNLIWPNVDRHPGPAARPPTEQEARAVVTLAATIVQWHRDGWVVQRR